VLRSALSISILALSAGLAAASPADVRLAAPRAGETVSAIPAWDPASPQRLVRVGGTLYQEDGGLWFPAEERRITVRLADGIADWSELVRRASASEPAAFALLAELAPLRQNRLGIVDLELPEDADAAAWCDLAFRTGLVRWAEVPTRGTYAVVPNDPQLGTQWGLRNTGQSGGTPGADIDAEHAWDLHAGTPSVVVAVLDSGTFVDHVDLAVNVWRNPGEIAGNGVDDDGNGFVDDHEGWDFPHGNNDPRSSNYHGTHVTGIVNAATANGIGISGVAGGMGGPGALAMAIEVGEFSPQGSILDDSILYAADNGAAVIQMSLSVSETSAINDALAYAYGERDVFIDCAAGNNGSSVAYPARNPNVMAVASTDRNDRRSSFSNPGPEVEVAAPGSSILSTQLANGYGTASGTSFAAPHVAGVAALLRGANPGLTAAEVRQILIDSAQDVESPGFDNLTGWGRIDAFAALSLVATGDGSIRLDPAVCSCDDVLTVTVTDADLAGTPSLAITVRSGLEPAGETLVLFPSGGSGTFTATIDTSSAAAAPDGAIQTFHGDTVEIEYVDADDGQGGTDVSKLATATTDCRAPTVSAVAIVAVGASEASVTWTTDEPATSVVRFGIATPPASQTSTGSLVVDHAVPLSGLAACTTYRVEVESADELGNTTNDDAGGAYHVFETWGSLPGGGVGPCHRGRVAFDRQTYGCGGQAAMTLTDVDLGLDPDVVETASVIVTSTTEPEGEIVWLAELGTDAASYGGSIDLDAGPAAAGDGRLAVAHGDLVTVTYLDADDGEGSPRAAIANALADCAGPAIRDLAVTEITSTRAEITWTTDEDATSRVDFGPAASLGATVEDTLPKTVHRLSVSAFDACDRVWFRVSGTDALGNVTVADLGGEPLAFDLRRIGGLVFHDNFETAAGWLLQGEWRRGQPLGLGSPSGDPFAAWSGAAVLGNDLEGSGAFPGDYEPITKDWAISPPIDASGASDLEIVLERKLGVSAGDVARISVFRPGEIPIWSSTSGVTDGGWTTVRHDVSAAADGQSAVRIGFLIDSNGPGQSFGWNLDELIVKDATEPDHVACGGCGGAPSFGGVRAVADADPCGPGGLTLEWDPAPAWGTGGAGTYEVHRGTTPDFVPHAGTLVAAGIVGTTWTDTAAPVDVPVWYVVRARNDESCGGGGLADANLVRRPGIETIDRPVPDAVGASLRASRVGVAHVRLSWEPVPGAAAYRVRRSESPDFAGAVVVGDATLDPYEDPGAAADPATFFTYRVTALSACGEEGP
jgi:hypothetical protein